ARDFLHGRVITAQRRAVLHPRGNAAFADHRREATDGVGAAAEPEQEDLVAGAPQLNDRRIAGDDVAGEPEAERLADEIVGAPPEAADAAGAGRQRPDAGIVERELLGRIDRRVRPAARRAIKLVDVAAALIDQNAAALAGPVGEDHDVLRHPGFLIRGKTIEDRALG